MCAVQSRGKIITHSKCYIQAFWRQPQRKKTMPDMASGFNSSGLSMPRLASFFDATAGVKKLVSHTRMGKDFSRRLYYVVTWGSDAEVG